MDRQRLFLRCGDTVAHRDYPEWGRGKVLQISVSTLPGGAAYVRIQFDDGQERTFFNDLNDERCAYYMGLIRTETQEGHPPFPW
ncbi:MAG: hypothetical protein ACYC9S_02355 [Leptospirales bacterium]